MDHFRLKVAQRIEEAMREIGVLLIAFAPLDVALSEKGPWDNLPWLLFFLGLGASLFTSALILERRRSHVV